jgi:hypothetical protein
MLEVFIRIIPLKWLSISTNGGRKYERMREYEFSLTIDIFHPNNRSSRIEFDQNIEHRIHFLSKKDDYICSNNSLIPPTALYCKRSPISFPPPCDTIISVRTVIVSSLTCKRCGAHIDCRVLELIGSEKQSH